VLIWAWGLGKVPLFDWDEVNFAECTREMRLTGEYIVPQIGFLPFWEKPPLFFWVQSLTMSLAGENAWGARLPNILIGAITLLVLFVQGRQWHSPAFGFFWMFFYGVSLLPAFYARSGLIDPLFNLFMFLATLQGARYLEDRSAWAALGMGVWAGLATLTKGPVGLLLPALAVGTLGFLSRKPGRLLKLAGVAALPYVALVGGWVFLLWKKGSSKLLADFWAYQWRLFSTPDAGHAGPVYYHFLVLLLGMFPASVWALGGGYRWNLPFPARALLLLTVWTVLIFSVVRTKILHYSSLAYYGVAYLAAWVWMHRRKTLSWPWAVIGGVLLLVGVATVAAGWLMTQSAVWAPRLEDAFVRAALLETPLRWSGFEGWPGFILLIGAGLLGLLPLTPTLRLIGLGILLLVWQTAVLAVFAPRVEAYSQGPLRAFCEQAAQAGAIVWPLGFKSYVPFFYGRMRPEASPREMGNVGRFEQALLQSRFAYPVLFVSRVDRYEPYLRAHALQVIARQGGYVLLGLSGGVPGQACGRCSFAP